MEDIEFLSDTSLSSPIRELQLNVERILNNVLNVRNDPDMGANKTLSNFGDDSIDDPNYLPTEEQTKESLSQRRNVGDKEALSRKQTIKNIIWKNQVVSRRRQSGKDYVNTSEKIMPARHVKPGNCDKSCPHNCSIYFMDSTRQEINVNFWVLTDSEKQIFYTRYITVERFKKQRASSGTSRKQNRFAYFLPFRKQKLSVCRTFFLATLAVTQRTIYYFFKKNFDPHTGGINSKKTVTKNCMQKIRKHIESFPCLETHYLKADAKKQYLESRLTVRKMFKLFKLENSLGNIKYAMYRNIFNTEYKLTFSLPKKNKCDTCYKYHSILDPNHNQVADYLQHMELNENGNERKKADRELAKIDKTVALISFDLQTVYNLPKGNVTKFFYKRKLNLFNLTGYCNINGVTYCSIWYETQCERSGNDIASALIKILKAISKDNPAVNKLILWSDSSVPQNRNRITSLALLKFCETSNIKTIIQRFSVPGHSRVQEVDVVHNVIERHLKNIEIHSPVSLLRHLRSMDYNNVRLKLMQMKSTDFHNYRTASVGINFNMIKIPFVTELLFEKEKLCEIKFKTDYRGNADYHTMPLLVNSRRKLIPSKLMKLPTVSMLHDPGIISSEKRNDIQSMLAYMPNEDVEFYRTILNIP